MAENDLITQLRNDPLEYKRQSGRTTRMFQRAIRTAATKPVLVLMKDTHAVDHWKGKIGEVPGLTIEGMKIKRTPEVDWDRLVLVGDRADHQLFIDHDVFESEFRTLFKHWVADDLPMNELELLRKTT